MMKFLLFLLPLILVLSASAQPGPDTLWTRFYGWTGDDTAFSIQQTADQGFVIAGTATVPADGHTDAFLIKADNNGIMQGWHSYGGDYDQGAYSVRVTYDGGYALAGYTSNADRYRGAYFVRVNSMGDTLCTWSAYATDPTSYAWGTSVAEWFDHSILFPIVVADPTYGGYGADVPLFPAMTCDEIWDFPELYGDNIKIHNLHVTSDAGFAMVGQRSDSASGPKQAFLWRPITDGYVPHMYGGNGYEDDAYDFAETSSGFLLAGASYDGQTDGIFLCKTNTAGNEDWIHRFVTQFDKWAEAMVPALGGGYILAGTEVTYYGDTDMLLVKVNDDGEIVWQKMYGTDADERAYDVVQTADGGFVLVGYSTAHVGVQAEWYIVKTLPDPELATPDIGNPVPQQYSLSAFPNPFNAATTIDFDVAIPTNVRVAVFDLLGRRVATVVDERLLPGSYERVWNAHGLPSGVYWCRLEAGSFTATRKLLLLK